MDRETLGAWVEGRRDLWLDLLRIYVGVMMFLKGIAYVAHASRLIEVMSTAHVPFGGALLAHLVVLAHIAGGVMLVVGLVTRLAAAVQIPIVASAVLFVHRQEGFFTTSQSLEYASLVLAILVVLTISGSGRLSVDHYARASRFVGPHEPLAA